MKTIFILLISIHLTSVAQVTEINKYDEQHKKHGYWIAYLDSHLNKCNDKYSASYYGYDYYENGKLIAPLQSLKRRIRFKENFPIKSIPGMPVLLEGTFYFFSSSELRYEETYSKGLPLAHVAYSYIWTGNLVMKEVIDYKKAYKNQVGSFYYERTDAFGNLIEKFYYGKNETEQWVITERTENKTVNSHLSERTLIKKGKLLRFSKRAP